MQVKRLLHIVILTQFLILISGFGQLSSHVADTDRSFSPSIHQLVFPHIVSRHGSGNEFFFSGTNKDSGHWILSFISEVESENEEERSHSAHKYIEVSKYLLNLLFSEDAEAFYSYSDTIEFVSEDLANTLSERIYLVLAVFRL